MRLTLLRILKHGTLAAVMLAVLGYFMAEIAAMFVASQPTQNRSADRLNSETASELNRLPYSMAAWGFALVAILELVWSRVRKPAVPPPPPPVDNTEKLLNELLQRAEAEAAKNQAPPSSQP